MAEDDLDLRRQLSDRLQDALDDDPASERTLRLAAAALQIEGECRLEEPYMPLQLVLGASGLQWCCTHHPQHCAPAAGDLKP